MKRRAALPLIFGAVLSAFALSIPATSLACAPYTLDDEDAYRLSEGVQWAFAGDVVEAVANPELPESPLAMVLRVQETIAGDVSLERLRIEQDQGCDGFWYRTGDRVIAAIGHTPGIRPPFTGITNYSVAVWVILDGKVDGHIRVPSIAGMQPATERELRALLDHLPATDMIDAAPSSPTPSPPLPFVAIAGILGATVTFRRLERSR